METVSDRICTSHVERSNLTMRMQIRRLTRLTNGFSKKWGNLKAALALYFAWYNFLSCSSDFESNTCDGSGIDESYLEPKRIALILKSNRLGGADNER